VEHLQSKLSGVALCLLCLLGACASAQQPTRLAGPPAAIGASASKHGASSMQALDDQITALRAGARLPDDLSPWLDQGRLSEASGTRFEAALLQSSEPEREALVRALLALGRRLDPLAGPGITLLREERVIALLAGPALKWIGAARDVAIEALLGSVPLPLLAPHGAALAADLRVHADASILQLVAKAKPAEAKALVQAMAAQAGAAADEPLRIASAAFGDARVEADFIARFESTRDAVEKGRLAFVLATMATPRSLQSLAAAMRTDLVVEMPMVMRRSVRTDIVAALSFVHPDLSFLWDNAVHDDRGYARIEAFCEQTFGTRWTQPRPPFLWIEGFPADAGS
jgi:hypothetical protein